MYAGIWGSAARMTTSATVRARHDGGPSPEPEIDRDQHRRLRLANLGVGLIHAVQALVLVLLANDFALPVVASFQDGPPGTASGEPSTLFEVRYGWAVAAFLGLAAIDHLAVAAPRAVGWYERQLRQGRNPARWAEYSISASLMVVLIAMLTGIDGAYALLAIFGVNASMILFGHLMERFNPDRRHVDWRPFLFGCIAGIVPWLAITLAIVGAEVEYGGVPAFVFGIFISLFVLFNSFAINQVLQYRRVGPWRSYLFGEAAYIVLSLTAKSAHARQVFAGAQSGS
jgi:hypothetical protein